MESKPAPVFIDTLSLSELLKSKVSGTDLIILNCTAYSTPEEGDPLLDHHKLRIPSADYLDLRYLRDISKPFPNMFPSEKQFIDLMKARGIKLSTRVILYDSKLGQPYWATRAFYIFSVMGHSNVSVLDGGLSKWVAEGRPTETSKGLETYEAEYGYKLDSSRIASYE